MSLLRGFSEAGDGRQIFLVLENRVHYYINRKIYISTIVYIDYVESRKEFFPPTSFTLFGFHLFYSLDERGLCSNAHRNISNRFRIMDYNELLGRYLSQ